jgi:TonB family protein
MRTLAFLALFIATTASADDTLAHQIAAKAGHPEAKVVTLEQERKLTAQPLKETIVWCDTIAGQVACSVEVGTNGEWRSQEFLPNLNGIEGHSVGVRWWLPEARALNPYRVGSGVKAPILVHRTEPLYTPEAKKARIGGIVILEAIIDAQGRVVALRVLKALPFGLSEAAVDAVRHWRFKPATRGGIGVPVLFDLTVNFRLP